MVIDNEIDRLAKTVCELRKIRGMSQADLCSQCCERSLLSHFENGDLKSPSLIIIRSIAQKLGYTVDELINLSDLGTTYNNRDVRQDVLSSLFIGDYDRAKAILDNNAKWRYQLADDQFFRYAYARYYYHCGQLELAKDMFLDAIKYTDPKLSLQKPTPKEYLCLIWYLICEAKTDFSHSKYENVFESKLQKVTLTINKNYSKSYNHQYVENYYWLAVLFEQLKRYEEAARYAELAAKYAKRCFDLAFLGRIYFIMGRSYCRSNREAKGKLMLGQAKEFFVLTEDEKYVKNLLNFQQALIENNTKA